MSVPGKQPPWMAGVRWACTICNKPPPCKCWVLLKCKCGAKTTVPRFPEALDYDEIETLCPDCQKKGK